MRREINLNQINGQVVDAAMKVHTALGPGLLENTYPEAQRQANRIAGQFQSRAAQGWSQTDGEQLRDLEKIKVHDLRRIGLRIQGAPRGRILIVCNPWRNAEDGAIDKQGMYFTLFQVPYDRKKPPLRSSASSAVNK